MSFKIILNWVYFIGTLMRSLAKSTMTVAPEYEKLVEANKRDSYIQGLEDEAKQTLDEK